MIVPGGGIALDGVRWIIKRPDFLLPVRVLSKLFRRLMIDKLLAAHAAGRLTFHGTHAALVNTKAFVAYLAPLKKTRWYVYAKRPLAGPKAVLAYLSRYTHRVAISNRRLIAADAKTVTFKVKDYRINGPGRYKTMTLDAHEFIRRLLIHVLPTGFHRIRHYGLLASGVKADNLALARKLLATAPPAPEPEDTACEPPTPLRPCPCCGSAMRIIEVFKAGQPVRPAATPAAIRIDTS
jgi:Putative transposase